MDRVVTGITDPATDVRGSSEGPVQDGETSGRLCLPFWDALGKAPPA